MLNAWRTRGTRGNIAPKHTKTNSVGCCTFFQETPSEAKTLPQQQWRLSFRLTADSCCLLQSFYTLYRPTLTTGGATTTANTPYRGTSGGNVGAGIGTHDSTVYANPSDRVRVVAGSGTRFVARSVTHFFNSVAVQICGRPYHPLFWRQPTVAPPNTIAAAVGRSWRQCLYWLLLPSR
jgi:hypothetical protein